MEKLCQMCVGEWGRAAGLIINCYICCDDKLWCCILWLRGVGMVIGWLGCQSKTTLLSFYFLPPLSCVVQYLSFYNASKTLCINLLLSNHRWYFVYMSQGNDPLVLWGGSIGWECFSKTHHRGICIPKIWTICLYSGIKNQLNFIY